MKFTALIIAAALSSCTTQPAAPPPPPQTAAEHAAELALAATEYACASATAALKTAIMFNNKLSVPTRAGVTDAIKVINPICSQENTPTISSTARIALDAALVKLTAAADEANR